MKLVKVCFWIAVFSLLFLPCVIISMDVYAIVCRTTGLDIYSVYCSASEAKDPMFAAAFFSGIAGALITTWLLSRLAVSKIRGKHWIILAIIFCALMIDCAGGAARDSSSSRRHASYSQQK